MSSVAFIDPCQDHRWDAFVMSHPDGLICHLSGWKQVLEGSFPHIKGYFPVIFDPATGDVRAGLPLYLVRSSFMGTRLVSMPFATLSDPLVTSKDDLAKLLSAATELATKLKVSRLEVRTLASAHLFENSDFKRIDFFKSHLLTIDAPLDLLVKRFHPTCVRRQLKRSERSGLELNSVSKYEDLQCFFRSYVNTRKRLGLPPQPFRFFEQLWRVFEPSGHLQILGAYYRGKPVASIILFKFRERVSWEFIGEYQAYRHLNPTHFLLWQAIRRASVEGYRLFDFGRTSPNNLGLMDFKRRWGTQVIGLPQFLFPGNCTSSVAYVENSISYRLVKGLVHKTPVRFLPLLGELCYRHMG